MKKVRNEWTRFVATEKTKSFSVTYNFKDDSIVPSFDPKNAYREVSYEREKGDKILTKIPLDRKYLSLSTSASLREFDLVVAIDTNTKMIGNREVSITGITVLSWVGDKQYRYEVPFCIEFTGLREPKEKWGWITGMEELSRRGVFRGTHNVLLVVDAYLNEIDEINNRTSPILDGYYLPKGFLLGYASADAGAEYLPNKALRVADKSASKVFKFFAEGKGELSAIPIESEIYETYRLIFGRQE